MEATAIAQAVEILRQRGEEPSARRIRKVLIELGQPGGSYRTIYEHLYGLGVREAPAPGEEADEGDDEARHAAEGDDPEPSDDDDAGEEWPPAAEVVAAAEAALRQARWQVQALDAEQPARVQAIATAREAVLQAVSRQLALLDARKRGLLPAVVGELIDGPLPLDEACLAIEEAVRAAGQDFRQARVAEMQTQRALAAARQHVLACQQALAEARREAQIRARAPELWRRRQAAYRARQEDPILLKDWANLPSDVARAKARHAERIDCLEREISAALATAAGG